MLKVKGLELAVSIDERYAKPLRAAKRAIRRLRTRASRRLVRGSNPAIVESPGAIERKRKIGVVAWYHTVDVGHGVTTPGFFDQRPVLHHYHLPESLAGQRALDVATFDGFWAFEFERRGAAEVIATDVQAFWDVDLSPARRACMATEELNHPVGTGFAIAHDLRQSRVKRQLVNVYELTPDRVGMFDLVMCSDLLLHLNNPIRALQRIRSVCRGWALIVDMYDPRLDPAGRDLVHYCGGVSETIWWTFSLTALEQMIRDAGFRSVRLLDRFELDSANAERLPPRAVFRADA